MDRFLKYIPGFRSNTKWKKIIAIIYYAMTLLMLSSEPTMFLFFAAAPFFVFSLIDVIISKKKNIPTKSAFIPLALSFVLMVIAISITPPADDTSANNTIVTQADSSQTTDFVSSKEDNNTPDKNSEISNNSSTTNSNNKENTNKDTVDKTTEDISREETTTLTEDTSSENSADDNEVLGNLEVHFIDVGQADSILIKTPTGESMLIDAGNNADSDLVYSYLKAQNIEKLNVVIGTHPHEDHIGSLDTVINNFDVEKVYMPKVSHTTKTFEDVLLAIKNKGLKITTPIPGDTFNLGQAKCTILAPNSSTYEELNNYSVVLKLEYGNTSFLFTGDAEDISEKEILNKGYDVKADLLKVGHHGSSTSTTESFLKAVSPKYAVISVGKDNKYGHPDNVVLERLVNANIQVYRTDEVGTIIATSDGKNITLDKNASTIQINAPPVANTQSNNESPEETSIADNNSTNNSNTESRIIIQNIDKRAEIVTIKNNSSEDINLKGWKLVSVTGNQSYTFPEYILKAGTSVTIASGKDAKGDLLWGKNNIWNNSKSDPGELYDNNGNLVFRYDD